MSNIVKTTKLEYKQKEIATNGEQFIDEYGELVDIAEELHKVFGDDLFQIVASQLNRDTMSLEDYE